MSQDLEPPTDTLLPGDATFAGPETPPDDDVEGHGLREMAAGVAVTAAVIGTAGAAGAALSAASGPTGPTAPTVASVAAVTSERPEAAVAAARGLTDSGPTVATVAQRAADRATAPSLGTTAPSDLSGPAAAALRSTRLTMEELHSDLRSGAPTRPADASRLAPAAAEPLEPTVLRPGPTS